MARLLFFTPYHNVILFGIIRPRPRGKPCPPVWPVIDVLNPRLSHAMIDREEKLSYSCSKERQASIHNRSGLPETFTQYCQPGHIWLILFLEPAIHLNLYRRLLWHLTTRAVVVSLKASGAHRAANRTVQVAMLTDLFPNSVHGIDYLRHQPPRTGER